MNGKGDRNRSCTPAYRNNFDAIFRKKLKPQLKNLNVYDSNDRIQHGLKTSLNRGRIP